MNHVAAVEADSQVAVHAFAVKAAHPAANEVFARGGFVVGLFVVGKPRGYGHAGPQLAVDVHVQALGELVDDDAVLIVGGDFLEEAGLDIAADKAVIVVQPFDERPAVLVLAQYVHGGAGAVDETAQLVLVDAFAVGRYQRINAFALIHVQNGDGLHQQFPAGFLIGNVVMKVLAKPDLAGFKAFQPFLHGFGAGGQGNGEEYDTQECNDDPLIRPRHRRPP